MISFPDKVFSLFISQVKEQGAGYIIVTSRRRLYSCPQTEILELRIRGSSYKTVSSKEISYPFYNIADYQLDKNLSADIGNLFCKIIDMQKCRNKDFRKAELSRDSRDRNLIYWHRAGSVDQLHTFLS